MRLPLATATFVLLLAAADPTGAAAERTLTGRYMSSFQDGERDLEAVFTPVDEDRWEVVFYFNFNGRDYAYSGVAEGSLTDGELSGEVENEGGRRTFVFRGEFEDGEFRGRHAELRRGRERSTGTLTLGK